MFPLLNCDVSESRVGNYWGIPLPVRAERWLRLRILIRGVPFPLLHLRGVNFLFGLEQEREAEDKLVELSEQLSSHQKDLNR